MRPDPIRPCARVRGGSERAVGDPKEVGRRIYDPAAELYPICRSITGNGVRQSLGILGRHIDIETAEVPRGTQVFDRTVRREWNIADAYIENAQGERVVDFRRSNLHVLNYSVLVRAVLPLAELKRHIYRLPDQPDLVPYRTFYYAERKTTFKIGIIVNRKDWCAES